MKTWSDRPFNLVTPLLQVAARGAVIAEQRAECEVIYEIDAFPGWLAKLYRPGFPKEGIPTLERLIELPEHMTAADRSLVDSKTAWPVSRIINGQRSVGVIMAKAPKQFVADVMATSGVKRMILELDHLVQLDPFYARRGLSTPSRKDRLRATRQLIAVGDLFERHNVVYGDWSYANCFWSHSTGEVFVIDVDACGFGSRHWVQTSQWEDPLSAHSLGNTSVDVYTDYYKLAMLTVRCLTGVRGDPRAALEALPTELRNAPLGRLVETCLTATDRTHRPSAAALLRGLDSTAWAGSVSGADGALTPPPGSNITGAIHVSHIRAAPQKPPTKPIIHMAVAPRSPTRSGSRAGSSSAQQKPPSRRAHSGQPPPPNPPGEPGDSGGGSGGWDKFSGPYWRVVMAALLCFFFLYFFFLSIFK